MNIANGENITEGDVLKILITYFFWDTLHGILFFFFYSLNFLMIQIVESSMKHEPDQMPDKTLCMTGSHIKALSSQ